MPKRQKPTYLLLGKVERPHGVRGELRVSMMTDYPERLQNLEYVYLGKDPNRPDAKRYTIDTIRFHKGAALIKFVEAPTRNDAELLRGQMVMIDLENAIPLEDNEVYLYQLIGLGVQTEDGNKLGTLRDVLETGANDVYVLDSPQYGELLIPAHEETLIDIDLDAETVTMRLPEGLLPE